MPYRGPWSVGFIVIIGALSAAFVSGVVAEPCNPVIDGTYCASQPVRPRDTSGGSASSLRPIEAPLGSLGRSLDQPATVGAMTFRGNGVHCIGLLRRGVCN